MAGARGFTHDWVQGMSEPWDFELKNNGLPINGTGFSVSLDLSQNSTPVSGVSVAWVDQSAGTVRVTGMGTLSVGEYKATFVLTDGANNRGAVPNGKEADRWIVRAVNA